MTTDQKIFLTLCGAEAAVLLLCRKRESKIGITPEERRQPIEHLPDGRPDALFEDFLNILRVNNIDFKLRPSNPTERESRYADFYIKLKLTTRCSDHLTSHRPIREQGKGYLIDLSVLKNMNKDVTGQDIIRYINDNIKIDVVRNGQKK